MAIIVHLDRLLAERGVKATEMSKTIGLTETNISLLRSGKVRAIRFSTLDAICTYLRCQPGDLLEWEQ